MSAPTVRWSFRYQKREGDDFQLSPQRYHSPTGAITNAARYVLDGDINAVRIVKLTRKTKPKVVRSKTITWFDNGISPHRDGPGQYWIDNFLHDQYAVNPKPGTSVAATYRLTLEELG